MRLYLSLIHIYKALSATTEETLLALDGKGFLIRRMYLTIGAALILGVIFR